MRSSESHSGRFRERQVMVHAIHGLILEYPAGTGDKVDGICLTNVALLPPRRALIAVAEAQPDLANVLARCHLCVLMTVEV